jgi:hypothetical protein
VADRPGEGQPGKTSSCGEAQGEGERQNTDGNSDSEQLTELMTPLATLCDVSVPAINQHLKRIFSDNELEEDAVVKPYLITATDGKSYPPDLQEVAVKTVLAQAELLCAEWVN